MAVFTTAMLAVTAGTALFKGIASYRQSTQANELQQRELRRKYDAYNKQAADEKLAYMTRASQTRQMHDFQITAIQKNNLEKTAQVKAATGGSGAVTGTGTTAHIVASSASRGKWQENTYTKKAEYEVGNIKQKGQERFDYFTSLASQAEERRSYLANKKGEMANMSFLTGGM